MELLPRPALALVLDEPCAVDGDGGKAPDAAAAVALAITEGLALTINVAPLVVVTETLPSCGDDCRLLVVLLVREECAGEARAGSARTGCGDTCGEVVVVVCVAAVTGCTAEKCSGDAPVMSSGGAAASLARALDDDIGGVAGFTTHCC